MDNTLCGCPGGHGLAPAARRALVASAVLALLVPLVGCGTYVTVERDSPAPFSAGPAYQLLLVQLTGRPDLQDMLGETFRVRVSAFEWWAYRDATNEQIAVFPNAPAGRAVTGREPTPSEVFLRLDAYDARVFADTTDYPQPDDAPPPENIGSVRVSFAATVVGPDGAVLMREREYAGVAGGEIDSRRRRRLLLELAAEAGIDTLLDDITPRRIRERIRFDDDAEDMEPVVSMVRGGNYAQAAEMLRRMRQDWPQRADVAYNLAVLTDAGGDYEGALELYREALELGYRRFYADSRDACARRLRDYRALTGR